MSALIGHAKAARIMADAMADTSIACLDAANRHMLMALSSAYHVAADRMEQAMRDEATPPTGDPV